MGTNAREVGPMTEAVAAELRAELGRQRLSMREFSRRSRLPLTTLQRTLSGKRAIDVDELFEICDWLEIEAGDIIEAAERVARAGLEYSPAAEGNSGLAPGTIQWIPVTPRNSDVPASQEDVALAASDDMEWQARQEAENE